MREDQILRKYMEGKLTPQELAQFKQRPEYAFLSELHQRTDQWKTPDYDKEGVLRRAMKQASQNNEISPSKQIGRVFTLRPFIKYAIAASVTILVGFFLWPTQDVLLTTGPGETLAGILPDQSSYILNAQSSISYSADDWEGNRILQLTGEAFFDVQKGSTFRVLTDKGEVRVLGTRFNVRSRGETYIVSCEEGSVMVTLLDSGDTTTLEAGQATMAIDGSGLIDYEVEETAPWRNGSSSFRNAPLSAALDEIEIQFDVKINDEEIDTTKRLSCSFEHSDLEGALEIVLTPLGLSFEFEEKGIIRISK